MGDGVQSTDLNSPDTGPNPTERYFWTMFSILGTGPGGRVVDTPTRLVTEALIPQAPYNSVLRFYDEGNRPLKVQIEELVTPMRERAVAPAWVLHPSSSPGVAEALAQIGFTKAEEVYGKADEENAAGTPPPPTQIIRTTRCQGLINEYRNAA